MQRRNTVQRELVLNAVGQLNCHATAEEIYVYIAKDYPSIGKGTVYRNLNLLAEEGKLLKLEMPGGPEHFDQTLRPHYHLLCTECGRVSDVEVEGIGNLTERVTESCGAEVTGYSLTFLGRCAQCASRSDAM